MKTVTISMIAALCICCGGKEPAGPSQPASSQPGPIAKTEQAPARANIDTSQHRDKFRAAGVPQTPLDEALAYFQANQALFENRKVIGIADYSLSSKKKRFFLLFLGSGDVWSEVVAHGSGKSKARGDGRHGDPNHDGVLDICVHSAPACCAQTPASPGFDASAWQSCNQANDCLENMTRTGAMKVTEAFVHAKHLGSMDIPYNYPKIDAAGNNAIKIEGVGWRNSDVADKEICFHEEWFVRGEGNVQGRSKGMPVFAPTKGARFFKEMQGGSFYYAYAPQCQ